MAETLRPAAFIDRDGVIQSLWMGEMNIVTLVENIARIQ